MSATISNSSRCRACGEVLALQVIATEVVSVMGRPDQQWMIRTFHAERQDLLVRLGIRRFTGLTNACDCVQKFPMQEILSMEENSYIAYIE